MRNRVAKLSGSSLGDKSPTVLVPAIPPKFDLRGVEDGYFHPKERVGGSIPPRSESCGSSVVERLTFRLRLFPQITTDSAWRRPGLLLLKATLAACSR